MAVFDHLARLPVMRTLLSSLRSAMDAGSEQRVRSVLDQIDLADLGAAYSAGWRRGVDQPYEEDPSLMGDRLPWAVRQLIRTDPKVHMCARALVATALTAEWEWEPGCDSALAGELAREANENFGWASSPAGRMARSFDEVIEEMMSVGPAGGFVYHEVNYRLRRIGAEQRWVVNDYLYRPPEAHYLFEIERDALVGVRQRGLGGFAETYIPAHKLLLMGYGAAADNPWGNGWARAVYPWVKLKKFVKDLIAAGAERDALGSIAVEIDESEAVAHGYQGAKLQKAIKTILDMASQYAGGARSWFSTITGIKVSRLQGNFNVAPLIACLVHANQEILAACVGAPLLELGVVAPGNRAIGELFTEKLIENVANILDGYGRRLGGPLGPGRGTATRVHDVNRGRLIDPIHYPVARHYGLRPDRIGQLLPYMQGLEAANYVTPTDRLERRILRTVGEVMDPIAQRTPEQRLQRAASAAGQAGAPRPAPAPTGGVAAEAA